jgi:type I restriction enzyme S subunit
MSFPTYAEYRDQDIKWLPRMPAHWRYSRLRWLSRRYSGGTPDKNTPEFWEDGSIPWLASGEVNQALITKPSTFISEAGFANSSAKWIPEGALVMALAGQGKTKGMVAQLGIRSTCNQSMAAIVPEGEIQPRFLLWWLQSNYQNIRNMAGGDLRDGLNLDLLGDIPCPLPLSGEQIAIAAFLDRETAKIDALVEEQKGLIELLKEKRQAVISQAVTKGLDPNVPLKDSGAEWLGKVPAHWQLSRLANLFSDTDERGNDELPVLTVSIHDGVSDDELDEVELDRKVTRSDDKTKYKRVKAGDLVYNMMRAWQGGFGTVTVDGMVSPAYVVARPLTPFPTAFIESLLRTPNAIEEMRGRSRGVTDFRLRLYWEEFKEIVVPLPPEDEVAAILEHLGRLRSHYDGTIEAAEDCIAILGERRSSLISAAVTGKIDVRGLAKAQTEAVA